MKSLYFDLEGRPCDASEWAALFESQRRQVARTEVGDRYVSTVWMGLEHGTDDQGRALIFESMTFPENEPCWRYATRAEAEEGHARMVAQLEAEREMKP